MPLIVAEPWFVAPVAVVEPLPNATEFNLVAWAFVPIATASSEVALVFLPIATAPFAEAVVLSVAASLSWLPTAKPPLEATAWRPIAVDVPVAVTFRPIATAKLPLALAS